jgi:hypothetical protein
VGEALRTTAFEDEAYGHIRALDPDARRPTPVKREEVVRALRMGLGIRAAAAQLGLDRGTVQRIQRELEATKEKRRQTVLERDLKRATAELLDKTGMLYARVNSGGYRGRMKGARKGTPDFLGYFDNGLGWVIETKCTHRDGCKCDSCDAQRAWQASARARNVKYILARTLDDVVVGLGLGRRRAG